MPDLSETTLPGVGVRHDLTCRSGRRLAVITRPSGRRELVLYDAEDPDAAEASIDLSADEADTVAQVLAATSIRAGIEHIGEGIIPGLAIDWVPVPAGSPPRTIGALAMRTTTGATVVAVVRDGASQPAPGPDDELRAGDTAVLVGTPEGIAAATRLIESIPS